MKPFTSYLNASISEDRNQFHIIVMGDEADIENTEEGKWLDSGVLDYWKRVEKPNADSSEVQLHIGRKKHVNTKSGRITWHVSGVKHGKQAFNDNTNGLTTALNTAKAVVKLPVGKELETVANENASAILGSIDYLPAKCKIFVFKIVASK